ncbi:hypothetical protein EXIGLDRAFT_726118 [Exidia glandulosa HHB12029]|uniref:Uncharacterized protein n=1 Tax=Exidia glandulosa HHB12029 TaxID=1314781 RepID=A0A165DVJ1_EXIGL|nr:hypothetical protein EXIGLDRAFT_726118 [Exidia glandulosa HHB12029]
MWSDDHDASLASHIDGLLDDALGDQEVVCVISTASPSAVSLTIVFHLQRQPG